MTNNNGTKYRRKHMPCATNTMLNINHQVNLSALAKELHRKESKVG